MTDKELRGLSRRDLLELLVAKERENQQLRQELEQARAELNKRQIDVAKTGTMAEAALLLNGIFDAADRAEWQRRVDAILALSLYDTGVAPEYGDELLTLSTCGETSAATDRRFAVLAVRIETGGQE